MVIAVHSLNDICKPVSSLAVRLALETDSEVVIDLEKAVWEPVSQPVLRPLNISWLLTFPPPHSQQKGTVVITVGDTKRSCWKKYRRNNAHWAIGVCLLTPENSVPKLFFFRGLKEFLVGQNL